MENREEEKKGAVTENEVLIITGMSGAGKSQAAAALEDLGYFCVDNLPPNIFFKFIEGIRLAQARISQIALVVDVRGGEFFYSLEASLRQIAELGVRYRVVFLEASDETLLHRFKETRRRHPLSGSQQTMLESIKEERRLLENLRGLADAVIDTSDLTSRQLSEQMVTLASGALEQSMLISFVSFGYKYGLPLDADLVLDVRFLPNPYYIEEMRPLNGLDAKVRDFVLKNEVTRGFMRRAVNMLGFLLPNYLQEGKKHLTIAIGCTGGQHRSVAIAGGLAKRFKKQGYYLTVSHRDIKKSKQNE
ncbi:MAG: RNase adapter RapZ [Clostridiales bacterium]|nr:RNase adapter RapZ [Clostridiales bacterium]